MDVCGFFKVCSSAGCFKFWKAKNVAHLLLFASAARLSFTLIHLAEEQLTRQDGTIADLYATQRKRSDPHKSTDFTDLI